MTASKIAKSLHGIKAGHGFMCKCPTRMHKHADRNRSLSVRESKDGWVMLKCFAGCTRDEILAAMGLKIRDLAINEAFCANPVWQQQRSDRDRLAILERRHGLFIMLQAVEPGKRNYWRAAERNTAIEIRELRTRIYPVEEYYRRRNERVQAIIAEYGIDELCNCLPERKPMKTFSNGVEAVGAVDWEGMTKQPIEYAALAVRQALSALEGSEETVFHNRMRVLRVARHLELWKLDMDPEVDQPFVSMKRWIQTLWPKSYRYCVDAWETEEALDDLPMAELTEVTGANLKVLRQVSSGVRGKGAVLKAARK